MLVQLVYTSAAAQEFTDQDLVALLATAVENNRKNNVTGLLVHSHGTFIQVLEGDAAVVDKLFAQISRDPRHHSIEKQLRTPVEAREFFQWHMGFRALKPADALALPNYAPFFEAGFDASRIAANPGAGLDLIRALSSITD